MNQRKITDMKLRLLAVIALLAPVSAFAQGYGSGIDGQSVFRTSETRPPLAYSATASRTTVISSDTRVIRVMSTSDAHIKIGTSSVVATANDTPLPAWSPEYFKLPQIVSGSFISAIQDTASGALFIDLMKP